tara:strand:+ start:640 stop:876 length:237 start_codon:yes stop_codon:yes gene_type:complete
MKRDVTGKTVDLAAEKINRVIDMLAQIVPMGPAGVEMSSKELSKLLQDVRGEQRASFMAQQKLTPEEQLEVLRGNASK